MNRLDWLAVAGVALIAAGCALWSIPLALIWLGLALIVASFLGAYANGRSE